ncbi:unnamed protein product [Rhodiola kirilowii]
MTAAGCADLAALSCGDDLGGECEKRVAVWKAELSRERERVSDSDYCSGLSLSSVLTYVNSTRAFGIEHPRFESTTTTLPTKGVGHLVRKGTGGRSSVSGIVAAGFLDLPGFLGRYVVQQLAKMGSQVLVPFRGSEDSPRHLKLMGDLGQIVPMKYNPRDESSIKAVMSKAKCRDYATRNFSIDEVNQNMAVQIAQVWVLRAKAAAEEAIMGELPESSCDYFICCLIPDIGTLKYSNLNYIQATVLKPAALIGTEDRIMNRWAHFAKKYGFIPLYGDGSTKIQPAYVVDVAAAVVAALKDDGTSMGKVYELGGPDIFTVHELAELMFEAIATPRELLINKLPFPLPTPEMINLDEINSLAQDTIVSENALTFQDLGIVPHKLKGYPIEFLISYRKGGPEFGSTVSEKVSPEDYP